MLFAALVAWPWRHARGAEALTDRQLARVTFDQRLDYQVPLSLPFRDEQGRAVKLGDYFGKKPVILVLGYYRCPMLCSLVLNGLVEGLQEVRWSIGNEFEVVNISINPHEGPALAAAKKAAYLKRYSRAGAGAGWHFLTGDEGAINSVADQVGFRFLHDLQSGEYAHPSGLVFLTPDGKVAGYQFGVSYKGSELLTSLKQARSGQPGSPVRTLILLCFHYNPISGKYGPAIMTGVRLLSLITLVALSVMIWRFARRRTNSGSGAAKEVPS